MKIILLFIQIIWSIYHRPQNYKESAPSRKKKKLFLFVIRLHRAADEHELGIFFNVSQATFHISLTVKRTGTTKPSIRDEEKLSKKQPTNPLAQQDTWSTYKNTNTAEAHVGITPNGVVSYISPRYAGVTSDKALLNMSGSGSLLELSEDNDAIMSDRGSDLDPKHKHLTFIRPSFLERKIQQLSLKRLFKLALLLPIEFMLSGVWE